MLPHQPPEIEIEHLAAHGPARRPTGARPAAIGLLLALLVGSGLMALTARRAQPAPTAQSVEPDETAGPGFEPVGGVADPPLPAAVPLIDFDPISELANHDGTVIVRHQNGLLRFVDGRSGTELSAVDVPGDGELRAVSTDGSLAALFEHRAGRSTISVVDGRGFEPIQTLVFDGVVEPEAFSTDGNVLFAIDHQIAQEPGSYRVRPINLETGELEVILGPSKVPLDEEMNGAGRRQVWSNDGSRLYTLYIRQTHHHHSNQDQDQDQTALEGQHVHGEPGTDGFVHVLDLDEEWAFCLDLPQEFGEGELGLTALAVSPAGGELAVLDLNAGRIAVASTDRLAVSGTAALPEDVDPDDRLHLGMFPTHFAVGWGKTLIWLDRPSLEPVDEVALQSRLLGLSSFDSTLLAWPHDLAQGPRQLQPPPEGDIED